MSITIACLGLGAMGAPMAANLVTAGFTVRAWNRTRARADALEGATATATPREAATGAAFVITMLADDAAVESVTYGPDGLLAGAAKGALHISTSTISLAATRRLAETHAERGVEFIAAPVFGRPDAARNRLLWIVPGGPGAALERAAPIFAAIGQGTFPMPSAERAILAKLAGNFMIGATIEALGEALVLAEKGGLDPELMLTVLTGSLFNAPVYRNYGPRIARTEFVPAGFTLPLALKDLQLVLAAASEFRTPMPLAEMVRDRINTALRRGREQYDFAGLATVIREAAGLGERRGEGE